MSAKTETYLFPGFSAKNIPWAEEIKDHLAPEIPVIVINWPQDQS